MRRIVLIAVLSATVAGGCKKSQTRPATEGIEALYSLSSIPRLDVTLDDESVAKLKKKPRKWVSGTLQHEGQTLANVGVRLKGHRSLRPVDKKASFKLRFDKYVEGQRFLGQQRMTLNAMVEDPSKMREFLGYRLYRELGVPAPRVGYAVLYVNGDRYGLYAVIEPMDEAFLADRFGVADGSLYEGEYGCDLYPEDVEGFEQDFGDKDDRKDLANLAAAVASHGVGTLTGKDALFDSESFLSYLAVSAFIGDFDGYRHSHNYRLYFAPQKGKWFLLPWGIDRSFKKNLSIYDSFGLLARLCFKDAGCRVEYLKTLERVIRDFEKLDFDSGVTVVAALTQKELEAGGKDEHTLKQILNARRGLREFIAQRVLDIREQLGCLGDGDEVDGDGDGYGCLDCDDANPAVHPGAAEVCDGMDNDCSGLADDAAVCACESFDIEGVEFHLCDLPMTWPDADALCKAKGMTLARIDSAEQGKRLFERAQQLSDERWWIGLSDRADEGTFVWADGSPVGYTGWSGREPNNDACNQDCAAMRKGGDGRWHDTHCAQPSPFICRAPTTPAP